MQSTDITDKVRNFIRFGLISILAAAAIIGYAEYKYWHKDEVIQIDDAKITGTMVSVRVLANGKVSELSFENGAEVKVGDVIARLEVAITEEEIRQLEDTVQLARDNYATLQEGQWIKVPVQRERVVYPPAPPPTVRYEQSAPSANLSALEERANRMAELFDMGAVSAVQRDAARRAYESALAESQAQTPIYEYSASPAPIIEYYTEYVDEFRPTPQEVLDGAVQAIKQAELSLNAALQEARETDVIAPVSGTIYYGVEVEDELSAGDSISKIGDSRELWIEAEVSEEVFNKIPLGKLVSYTIDGRELFGTVIEKISPNVAEPVEEIQPSIELPEIPTSENAPASLIGDNPSAEENPQPEVETPPAQIEEDKIRSILNDFRENPQIVEAEVEVIDVQTQPEVETPPVQIDSSEEKIRSILNEFRENPQSVENAQPAAENPQPVENSQPATENPQPVENAQPTDGAPQPPKMLDGTENQPKPNDKFIIKISLPAERDFECNPNTKIAIKIKI